MAKPSKEVKRVMWKGHPGDEGSPYEFHGMKFFPRVVQPVSDEVFEAVKHIHNFITVDSVRNAIYDYDNVEGFVPRLMGSIMNTDQFFSDIK